MHVNFRVYRTVELPYDVVVRCMDLIHDYSRLEAVKEIRAAINCDLVTAKQIMEQIADYDKKQKVARSAATSPKNIPTYTQTQEPSLGDILAAALKR